MQVYFTEELYQEWLRFAKSRLYYHGLIDTCVNEYDIVHEAILRGGDIRSRIAGFAKLEMLRQLTITVEDSVRKQREESEYKMCNRCRKEKPVLMFKIIRRANTLDSRRGICQECENEINRRYRANHKENTRAISKKHNDVKRKLMQDPYIRQILKKKNIEPTERNMNLQRATIAAYRLYQIKNADDFTILKLGGVKEILKQYYNTII